MKEEELAPIIHYNSYGAIEGNSACRQFSTFEQELNEDNGGTSEDVSQNRRLWFCAPGVKLSSGVSFIVVLTFAVCLLFMASGGTENLRSSKGQSNEKESYQTKAFFISNNSTNVSNSTDNADSNSEMKAISCRTCTFTECISSFCDKKESPFTCLVGDAAGGCSKTETFLSSKCDECCSLEHCYDLMRLCGDCTAEDCDSYKGRCGESASYVCTEGKSLGGCTDKALQWPLLQLNGGTCNKCCNLESCKPAIDCSSTCTPEECLSYEEVCGVKRPFVCTDGVSKSGCSDSIMTWETASDVGLCGSCCDLSTCSTEPENDEEREKTEEEETHDRKGIDHGKEIDDGKETNGKEEEGAEIDCDCDDTEGKATEGKDTKKGGKRQKY